MAEGGYLSAVRKEAWGLSKEHFAWTYPILAGVAVFVFTVALLGPEQAMEDLATTLIAGGAAVVVALGGYVVNLVRASERLYAKQEVKKEVYRQSIDGLLNDIAQLRVALEDRRKNQAFANALTERYDHGLHEIMNWGGLRKRAKFNAEIAAEWHRKEKEWTQGVRKLLVEYGCNPQIVAHFVNIHKVVLGGYHPNGKMNQSLSMFSIRLDRLKGIINTYSETPILSTD